MGVCNIFAITSLNLDLLQEHQTILTNATLSKVSDLGFVMVVCEKLLFTILKCLEEIRKCVSEIILQKNILYWGDLNYIGTFPQ